MRKLLMAVYSVWCYLAFALFVPMGVVVHLLGRLPWAKEKVRSRFVLGYQMVWVGCWQALTGFRFHRHGYAHFDPQKAYVLVCNHINLLDILVMGFYMRHHLKVLIKQAMHDFPVMGFLFRTYSIPVDKTSAKSRKESLDRMVAVLKSGVSILIFPEGTRNRTGQPMKSFYDGAFILALEAGIPILPMVITHSRLLQPVESWTFRPGNVHLTYLPPIPVDGYQKDQMQELKQHVFDVMLAALMEREPEFGGTLKP